MKGTSLFFILCIIAFSVNQVFALSYKDPFPTYTSKSSLSDSKRSEAKLLQIYVSRYKEKINTLYTNYSSKESQVMRDANTILDTMSTSLQKLQDNNISDSNATSIMQSIVNDLKTLNKRMKVYLEQESSLQKKKIKKIKNQYSPIVNRISAVLDSIISRLSWWLAQKTNLNNREKEIVRSLIKIREQNNKLKLFWNISFSRESEIKIYLKNTIGSIRTQILIMKRLSN